MTGHEKFWTIAIGQSKGLGFKKLLIPAINDIYYIVLLSANVLWLFL